MLLWYSSAFQRQVILIGQRYSLHLTAHLFLHSNSTTQIIAGLVKVNIVHSTATYSLEEAADGLQVGLSCKIDLNAKPF